MRAIGIASDSTSDLSRELEEKYDIHVLPLLIHLDEKEYRDRVDITIDELFEWSEENKKTPKTAAFSPSDVEELLKKMMEEYEEVIFFTISSPMSSCHNIVELVAEEMGISDKVHVVDSANLSTGVGQLAIEASIMADKGCSSKEILEEIERLKPLVRVSFVVDTMTYLYRGGRCGGMTALVAGSLKIHPCIEVVDGAMRVGKKYRGKLEKVVKNYLEDIIENLKKGKKERIFISHAKCNDEIISYVKNRIEELNHFDEILITNVGGIVSCHCGPGTLGIVYIDEPKNA